MNRENLDSNFICAEGQWEDIEDNVQLTNIRNRLVNLTATFSGAILRKAEFENNFDKVYSRVIEKMVQFEFVQPEDETILEIFGEVGG